MCCNCMLSCNDMRFIVREGRREKGGRWGKMEIKGRRIEGKYKGCKSKGVCMHLTGELTSNLICLRTGVEDSINVKTSRAENWFQNF